MTCDEFRHQFDEALDERIPASPLQDHLMSCPSCREYSRSMNAIVGRLQNITRENVPEKLLERIHSIPDYEKAKVEFTGWKKDIRRAALYLVPCAVLYCLAFIASPELKFLTSNLIMLASLIVVMKNVLKRPILG